MIKLGNSGVTLKLGSQDVQAAYLGSTLVYSLTTTTSTTSTTTTTANPIPSGAAVFYDFGNVSSYPGSGSTVFDLSGNAVNGTLVNSPTFSSTNGGILRLNNASSQRIDFTPTFTPETTVIAIWQNVDSTFTKDTGFPDATFAYGIKYAPLGGTKNFTPILMSNAGSGNTFFNAAVTATDITQWHQWACVVTVSGTNSTATNYLDGTASSATETKSFNRSGTSGSGTAYLGWDRAIADRYANGYLMAYLQYNRALTTSELNSIYSFFNPRWAVTTTTTAAPTTTTTTVAGCVTWNVINVITGGGTAEWKDCAGNMVAAPVANVQQTKCVYPGYSPSGSGGTAWTYVGDYCSPAPTTTTTTAAPTTTTTTQTPLSIDYLIVAGGGGGGWSNSKSSAGAGGGAGGFLSGSTSITTGAYAVTVGTGGTAATNLANSTNGTNSSFNSLTATGGGRGGRNGNTSDLNGGNGGSGGGAVVSATAGTGTAGQGFDGSVGYYLNDTVNGWWGGAGGGAGTAGVTRTAGSGKLWLDGNGYAAGGEGANGYGPSVAGGYGNGGYAAMDPDTAENGADGIVIIRYSGSQVASGGTVTSAGGYTYHTFTTSGTFTYPL